MPTALKEHSAHPLNAETRLQDLTQHLITPNDLLFHRNHEELPTDAELHLAEISNKAIEECTSRSEGIVLSSARPAELPSAWKDWPIEFSIDDLLASHVVSTGVKLTSSDTTSDPDILGVKMTMGQVFGVQPAATGYTLPPPSVILATIECAGNRRSEMNKSEEWGSTEGIEWGGGVIGCGVWQGITLRDFLLGLGLEDPYRGVMEQQGRHDLASMKAALWAQNLHLHFLSRESSGRAVPPPQVEVYGASLPLSLAMHPASGIHLVHTLNGVPLSVAHGAPLRAVIPGHLGARWVKWLSGLRVTTRANESEPMLLDYKIMSPSDEEWKQKLMGDADGKGKDEAFREQVLRGLDPLMRLPVGSEVASPQSGEGVTVVEDGNRRTFEASGYAVGQEGSLIDRVEYIIVGSSLTGTEKIRALAAQQPASAWKSARVRRPRLEKSDGGGWAVKEDVVDECARADGEGYAWALWDAEVELPENKADQSLHLVVRAVTARGFVQEQTSVWNVRGMRNRSWPVVELLVPS